ncbi:hypothetical protein [Archangium lansingense]|uniref:Lipoprotein n=1 Tax=Archangium lansingense TaxID=2995310 RepID=A0ABT4AFC7_9BACT|nr:hypothetical protein [Archangium lansinium]MCY1080384.1 hypothetical protein [Archangium lansinium]
MRRRVLIALLAFGTLAGYSSGFASLYRWHRYGHPYGGHCRQGRNYDDPSRYGTWAPARAPQQAQAPAPSEAPPAPQGQQVQ